MSVLLIELWPHLSVVLVSCWQSWNPNIALLCVLVVCTWLTTVSLTHGQWHAEVFGSRGQWCHCWVSQQLRKDLWIHWVNRCSPSSGPWSTWIQRLADSLCVMWTVRFLLSVPQSSPGYISHPVPPTCALSCHHYITNVNIQPTACVCVCAIVCMCDRHESLSKHPQAEGAARVLTECVRFMRSLTKEWISFVRIPQSSEVFVTAWWIPVCLLCVRVCVHRYLGC